MNDKFVKTSGGDLYTCLQCGAVINSFYCTQHEDWHWHQDQLREAVNRLELR